jgi:hypothetical protein
MESKLLVDCGTKNVTGGYTSWSCKIELRQYLEFSVKGFEGSI